MLLLQTGFGALYSSLPWYVPFFAAAWVGLLVHVPVLFSYWIWKKVHLVLVPGMLIVIIGLFVFTKVTPLGELALLLGFASFVFGLFSRRMTLRSLAGILLLVLVVAGLAWGKNYLYFFPVEAAFRHLIHRDTMLHSAIASFIGNNLYPSVGIAGTEYFPYNWLPDYLIAAFAQGSGQPAYVVICLVYPVVVFSFVLFVILSFLELRHAHQQDVLVVGLSVVLLGLFPMELLSRTGIWPESFLQESFLLSIGLFLVSIREILSPTRASWHLVLVFGLALLTGMAKVSAVFVLVFFALGFVIYFKGGRQPLLRLVAVALGALVCYVATKGPTAELTLGPLANLRSPKWLAPVELTVNFLPAAILWFLWWWSKLTKIKVADRTQALQLGVLVSGIAVLLLYTLFYIRAGAGFYFLETWRVACWLTIVLTVSQHNCLTWREGMKKTVFVIFLAFLLGNSVVNFCMDWGYLAKKHLALMGVETRLSVVSLSVKSILFGRGSSPEDDLGEIPPRLFYPISRPTLPTLPPSTSDSVVVVPTRVQWETLLGPQPVEPLYLAGLTGLPVAGLIPEKWMLEKMYGYGAMSPLLIKEVTVEGLKRVLYRQGYRTVYVADLAGGFLRLRADQGNDPN